MNEVKADSILNSSKVGFGVALAMEDSVELLKFDFAYGILVFT
jgi:hypothetical protein